MSKPGKFLLSGGLILASGAYAWWEHKAEPQATAPAPVPVRAPARTPHPAPQPPSPLPDAPPPTAEAMPVPGPKKPQTKTALARPAVIPAAPEVQPQLPDLEPLQAVQLAPPPAVSTGRYTDGEFVGDSIDTEWGPVQVKLVVRNGDIVDAICIVYPIHRRRSAEISEWAIPILREEVIKAQSEKIDMISQASFTSEGYQMSLASAVLRASKK